MLARPVLTGKEVGALVAGLELAEWETDATCAPRSGLAGLLKEEGSEVLMVCGERSFLCTLLGVSIPTLLPGNRSGW